MSPRRTLSVAFLVRPSVEPAGTVSLVVTEGGEIEGRVNCWPKCVGQSWVNHLTPVRTYSEAPGGCPFLVGTDGWAQLARNRLHRWAADCPLGEASLPLPGRPESQRTKTKWLEGKRGIPLPSHFPCKTFL